MSKILVYCVSGRTATNLIWSDIEGLYDVEFSSGQLLQIQSVFPIHHTRSTCKLDASKCLFLIVGIHIRPCGCLHVCVCVCVHAFRIISPDKIFRCIKYYNNNDDEDYNNNYIISLKTTVVLWLVLICLGN